MEVLRQIPDQYIWAWSWGLLPCLPLFYLLGCFLYMRVRGDAFVAGEIRAWKSSKSEYFFRSAGRLAFGAACCFAFLLSVPLLFLLNLCFGEYVGNLLEKMDSVCSIVIGLTTIVITASVVIILFSKKYYLVFSIEEVLRAYRFTDCLGYLMATCMAACVSTVLLLNQPIGSSLSHAVLLVFEGSVIGNLTAAVVSFRLIYKIMFSDEKIELKLLDKLCRVFREGGVKQRPRGKESVRWEPEAVRTNVEYLAARYVMACRKLPVSEMTALTPMAGEAEREGAWERCYGRIKRGYSAVAAAAYLVSSALNLFLLREKGLAFLLLDTAFLAASFAVLFSGNRAVRRVVSGLFMDTLGYTADVGGRKGILIHAVGCTYPAVIRGLP